MKIVKMITLAATMLVFGLCVALNKNGLFMNALTATCKDGSRVFFSHKDSAGKEYSYYRDYDNCLMVGKKKCNLEERKGRTCSFSCASLKDVTSCDGWYEQLVEAK